MRLLLLIGVIASCPHHTRAGDDPLGAPWIPEALVRWEDGLHLLHTSRADEGLKSFLARHRQAPEDICGFYFPAMVFADFDLDRMGETTRRDQARELLEDGIKMGRLRVKKDPGDLAAAYCLGGLYALRARDHIAQGKHFGAAYDAKRARNTMLAILEKKPDFLDCRYFTGSYDYFADVLPNLFKFLRVFLFIPGGNRDRGLEAIQEVSRTGRLSRYEAFLVLHEIHGALKEDGTQSLAELGRFHRAFPESSRVTLLLGRAHLRALDPEAALTLLRPDFEHARDQGAKEIVIAPTLAMALIGVGLHDEAETLLQQLRARHEDSPRLAAVERAVEAYDANSSRIYYDTLPARRLGRDKKIEEAKAAFKDLIARYGEDPQINFWTAEMYFEARRDVLAAQYYRKVLHQGVDFPEMILRASYLRLGNIADLQGNRDNAREYYRQTIEQSEDAEDYRAPAQKYLKKPYKR